MNNILNCKAVRKRESVWFEVLIMALFLIVTPTFAEKHRNVSDGARLFAQYCTKCHTAGGNLVVSSRPITGSSKLENLMGFKAYLSTPPGHMPYYQNLVGNQKKLKSLYDYCKSLTGPPVKQASRQEFSSIQ